MAAASIDGRPAALADAVREAVRLLVEARSPIIAGLGADIAAARAAIRLAEALRCPFDHLASDAVLAALSVMRDAGWMVVSPDEARRIADVALIVGPVEKRDWEAVMACRPDARSAPKIVVLGATALARHLGLVGYEPHVLVSRTEELPGLLAALRARVAGRSVAGAIARKLDPLAAILKAGKFGVACWSPASLDRLTAEMLAGLVKDLNAETRFSSVPLPVAQNGLGVAQASGWLTGYPMRTSFSRGHPEHDPWRFDAVRMVEDGEADAALWISAYGAVSPPWERRIELVAVTSNGALPFTPRVQFEVGVPGLDHDAVAMSAATGALAHIPAMAPSEKFSAAYVIESIAREASP